MTRLFKIMEHAGRSFGDLVSVGAPSRPIRFSRASTTEALRNDFRAIGNDMGVVIRRRGELIEKAKEGAE